MAEYSREQRNQLSRAIIRNEVEDNQRSKFVDNRYAAAFIDSRMKASTLKSITAINATIQMVPALFDQSNLYAASSSAKGIGSIYFRKNTDTDDATKNTQQRIRLVHKSGPEVSRSRKNVKWYYTNNVDGLYSHHGHKKKFGSLDGLVLSPEPMPGSQIVEYKNVDAGAPAGDAIFFHVSRGNKLDLTSEDSREEVKTDSIGALYNEANTNHWWQTKNTRNRRMTNTVRDQIKKGNLSEKYGQEIQLADTDIWCWQYTSTCDLNNRDVVKKMTDFLFSHLKPEYQTDFEMYEMNKAISISDTVSGGERRRASKDAIRSAKKIAVAVWNHFHTS